MFPCNILCMFFFFLIAASKLLLFTQGKRTASKAQSKEILKALSNPVDLHDKRQGEKYPPYPHRIARKETPTQCVVGKLTSLFQTPSS